MAANRTPAKDRLGRLWRITDRHELDNLDLKAAVIAIGTNNGHSASQVVGGIAAIVEELKR